MIRRFRVLAVGLVIFCQSVVAHSDEISSQQTTNLPAIPFLTREVTGKALELLATDGTQPSVMAFKLSDGTNRIFVDLRWSFNQPLDRQLQLSSLTLDTNSSYRFLFVEPDIVTNVMSFISPGVSFWLQLSQNLMNKGSEPSGLTKRLEKQFSLSELLESVHDPKTRSVQFQTNFYLNAEHLLAIQTDKEFVLKWPRCEVHSETMNVSKVPVNYGLFGDAVPLYSTIQNTPNSKRPSVSAGCVRGQFSPLYQVRYDCSTCNRVYRGNRAAPAISK